ncbi:hypothetical protein M404DRAFT_994893 [Pisolithus tinctorius Marx 270]|uniref:WW domain-containing protein n=1 Tax=Pisolithus tinctorius Marx 270 TaxID=870435 RepID=A0A0C3JPW4_PISTI|nr:hypothetical protein M404DRAFT_994893 [Pisolithus tinctorius Marx 270]
MTSPSPAPSSNPEDQLSPSPSRGATSEPSPEPESAATTSNDKVKVRSTSPDTGDAQSSSASDTAPSSTDAGATPASSGTLSAGAWQAIYSPQHGAYYFHNTETRETTWVNPIQQPSAGPSSSTSSDPNDSKNTNHNPYDPNSLEARAMAAGIDPSLAHLDPSLALPAHATPGGAFTARFNARTGAFTAADGRTPQHLSEYERMKRMSEFYFDTSAWEKEVEERQREEGEVGKKRKRPSKKDLVSVMRRLSL